MSLILEALKKLERDKEPQGRTGFLVMAARPWPSHSGRGLIWISLSLAALGLVAVLGTGLWWWFHRGEGRPPEASSTAPAAGTKRAPMAAPAAEHPVVSAPLRTARELIPVQEPEAASPAATDAPPPPAAPASPPSAFRLTATSHREGRPVAILNDRLVYEGDSFDGVKIVKIRDNAVELDVGGERRVVEF